MMWFVERIIALLIFPVDWFWRSFERYKDTKSIGKIILLFVGSLSGLVLLGGTLIWIIFYLINFHFEWVVIVGIIIWIYAYIKSKMEKTEDITPIIDDSLTELQLQAEKGYPIIRNIIYQTLKEAAPDIGGRVPRVLQEIEIPESHYVIAHGICFYQFKVDKTDWRMQYQLNELIEFRMLVQNVCSKLINMGNFPTLQMQSYMDAYGNWHDAVCIDIIEDIGNTLIIQAVFVTPTYAEYLHQVRSNQNDICENNSVPVADWK